MAKWQNKKLLFAIVVPAVAAVILLLSSQLRYDSGNIGMGSIFPQEDFAEIPVIRDDSGEIELGFTDDNEGENIIIRSDKKKYFGFSSSNVYFSLANESGKPELLDVQFYFPAETNEHLDFEPNVKKIWRLDLKGWAEGRFIEGAVESGNEKLKGISGERGLIARNRFQAYIKPGEIQFFKSRIDFPPGSEGEFLIGAIGQGGAYGLLDPWYSSSWSYRRKFTVDGTKVSGTSDLSDFPLLVSVTNDDLRHTSFGGRVASGSGGDILFTSSDMLTKIPHEIEKYTSSSGELIAWVKIPTVSVSSTTVFYMYYGGSATGQGQEDRINVWDSNYKGVWHHGADSGGNANDSTSNGNNGSLTNTTWSSGQIGNALSFDGSSSKNDLGSRSSLNMTTTVTVSGWFITDVSSTAVDANRIYIHSELGASPWNEYGLGQYDTKVRWELETSDSLTYFDSTTTLVTGTWYYAVGTWDGTTMRVYINGNQENSALKSGTITNHNDQSDIGFGTAAGNYFDGILDEIRVSNIARSAGWIATEYNNQSNPSGFAAMGGEETMSRTAPSLKIKGGVKVRGGVKVK